MNVILLDKSQEEIAAALAGCEVGVPKQLLITVTPTTDDETNFVATVDSVEYSEEEEAAEPVEPPEGEAPYKPKARKSALSTVTE